jgi:hypothetical protein
VRPLVWESMDIGEFYDADDRRRQSAEIELGTEWHDSHGVRYELNWIEDTGEMYVMREPPPRAWEDPFGDVHVQTGKRAPVSGMTVVVVARIGTRERMDEILSGWEQAMEGQDSVQWLADRLKAAGVADRAWAGEPT